MLNDAKLAGAFNPEMVGEFDLVEGQ